MLTIDYASRVADPDAERVAGEFALSDDLTLEAAGADSEVQPVFSAPVLDRIRTCD